MSKNNPFVYALWAVYICVDGMTDTSSTTTEWYWTNSGRKISYAIPWQSESPQIPEGTQYCLTFTANEPSSIGFVGIQCEIIPKWHFVCQRVDYFIPARVN